MNLKKEKMYTLTYNKQNVEGAVNKPKAICLWKKKQLMNDGNHSHSKFELKEVK